METCGSTHCPSHCTRLTPACNKHRQLVTQSTKPVMRKDPRAFSVQKYETCETRRSEEENGEEISKYMSFCPSPLRMSVLFYTFPSTNHCIHPSSLSSLSIINLVILQQHSHDFQSPKPNYSVILLLITNCFLQFILTCAAPGPPITA
ncbi:hypothetical protein RRG08_015402 [Elysia crispata]|uniref:Uncharacterized protein n=1 Tax=Elysia crispata TaxID=231223 RepID=A0AAE1ATX5_9GAST|nr:hypothetical protein RRG08_015402 [Elysia crispata]